MTNDADRRAFGDLLPFYANNTAIAAEQAFVLGYLRDNPAAAAQLAFVEHLRQNTQGVASRRPADEGLRRLLRDLAKARTPEPQPTWRQRLWRWGAMPLPVSAAALAIIVAQALYIHDASLDSAKAQATDDTSTRGAAISKSRGVTLKLTVRGSASVTDLLALLQTTGCHLIGGPSPAGEIWVAIDPDQDVLRLRTQLLASGLIDDVLVQTP